MLRRTTLPARAAIDRGLTWLAGMQSKDGGWGAFDADNTRMLVNKLPFCDFGELSTGKPEKGLTRPLKKRAHGSAELVVPPTGRASRSRRGRGARPCGPPVFSSSMEMPMGRDGRNDWTTARATMVCRAQQPQS